MAEQRNVCPRYTTKRKQLALAQQQMTPLHTRNWVTLVADFFQLQTRDKPANLRLRQFNLPTDLRQHDPILQHRPHDR